MTVIAYKDGILVADKLVTTGGMRQTTTKIFRHGKELIGIAGELGVGIEMLTWYRSGAEPAGYPDSLRTNGECKASLVVIRANGEIWEYESHSPYPAQMQDKLFAAGSGAEGAMVAMMFGASAEQAVQAVCKINVQCGNGITVLHLKEPKVKGVKNVK